MAQNIRKLTVFVASPNDVSSHREAVRSVIDEINQTVAADKGYVLQPITWTDLAPAMGRPQQVILDQIGDFDIFIGIMGRRFGKPTGKYESGTEEEFYLAYERWEEAKRPHILFYFNQASAPMPKLKEEVRQMGAVLKFRAIIETMGTVKDFKGKQEFVNLVRKDLASVIRSVATHVPAPRKRGRRAALKGDYWEIWRDASLPGRLPGERTEATIYRSAMKNVKFMTISGRSIYSGNIEEVLQIKPRDFTMRLLLFDWNSPEFPGKMRDERRNNDVMIDLARQKARSIAKQFLNLADGFGLDLKIKLYRDYPVWRLLITDDRTAYMGYYPPLKRGYEGPMFVFKSGERPNLFEPVNYYFDTMWEKSGVPLAPNDKRLQLVPLKKLANDR